MERGTGGRSPHASNELPSGQVHSPSMQFGPVRDPFSAQQPAGRPRHPPVHSSRKTVSGGQRHSPSMHSGSKMALASQAGTQPSVSIGGHSIGGSQASAVPPKQRHSSPSHSWKPTWTPASSQHRRAAPLHRSSHSVVRIGASGGHSHAPMMHSGANGTSEEHDDRHSKSTQSGHSSVASGGEGRRSGSSSPSSPASEGGGVVSVPPVPSDPSPSPSPLIGSAGVVPHAEAATTATAKAVIQQRMTAPLPMSRGSAARQEAGSSRSEKRSRRDDLAIAYTILSRAALCAFAPLRLCANPFSGRSRAKPRAASREVAKLAMHRQGRPSRRQGQTLARPLSGGDNPVD